MSQGRAYYPAMDLDDPRRFEFPGWDAAFGRPVGGWHSQQSTSGWHSKTEQHNYPETETPMDDLRMGYNGDDDGEYEVLPRKSEERKAIPLTTGVLDYFPAALAEVAKVSRAGNDKHNPGQPLHHARGKSTDHADSIARHLLERGGIDPDTDQRHSAELAWRALANLQQELEDAGAPLARGAREES